MASIECERDEETNVELSMENRASLDETINQAELSLQSPEVLNQSLAVVAENECLDEDAAAKLQITMVVGTLKNKTKGPLSVMAKQIFDGYIGKNFPNPLDSIGAFAMSSIFSKGVKAAVVYSGKNKAGVECGWLLAFADTKTTGKRIYVDCGCKAKFNNINWKQVEQSLDHHTGTIAYASDKDTGTSVYATIVGASGRSAVAGVFLG